MGLAVYIPEVSCRVLEELKLVILLKLSHITGLVERSTVMLCAPFLTGGLHQLPEFIHGYLDIKGLTYIELCDVRWFRF